MRRAHGEPLLRLAEDAINAVLALDPDSVQRARALSGRVFALELLGLQRTVYVVPGAGRLHLADQPERDPDVTLRASPLALLALARRRTGELATGEGVEIRGDVAAARALQDLLAGLDIDWEELLSRVTGDVLAHQLGNLARVSRRWARASRESVEQDLSEFARYEQELVALSEDVEGFAEAVSALRDDVERLEQRVRRLGAREGEDRR